MRKIEVVKLGSVTDRTTYCAPHCRAEGSVVSRPASPPEVSLWMLTAELGVGTTLRWDARHGDEAIFVSRGELEVDGRICPTGGAVVIEADARPTVIVRAPARVVHVGSRADASARDEDPAGMSCAGGNVHVVGPRGTFEAPAEAGRETRFFADASCPTCRLWLLYTARAFLFESPIHSHSQDELIHVLHGEISLGSLSVRPGETLFIAANQPYQLRSGEAGFGFLNYRRDASEMTTRPGGEKTVESGVAAGFDRVVESLA